MLYLFSLEDMNMYVGIKFWGKSDLVLVTSTTFYPNYCVGDIIYIENVQYRVVNKRHFVDRLQGEDAPIVFNLAVDVEEVKN